MILMGGGRMRATQVRTAQLDPTAGITPDILDGGLADDLAAASLALARRFSAGATMWCVAPRWEPHAHHMAVEFVHPVIVGKRALPAFALTDRNVVAQARVSVRIGDILIAVAGADEPGVQDLMRRAQAWGALSVWIGSGDRPSAGAADHVLWIDDANPLAPATGRFVLMYHLLWELTHVCFEHPGLLAEQPGACTDEVCVTCSDEGRLAEVIVPPDGAAFGQALVRTATGEEHIDVSLVGSVAVDDLVLVHAGSALTRIASGMTGVENTGFLYPFIDADERDSGSLLTDLAASARAKAQESAALQRSTAGRMRRADRRVRGRHGRALRLGRAAVQHSATAAARRTAPRSRRCSRNRCRAPAPRAQPGRRPGRRHRTRATTSASS